MHFYKGDVNHSTKAQCTSTKAMLIKTGEAPRHIPPAAKLSLPPGPIQVLLHLHLHTFSQSQSRPHCSPAAQICNKQRHKQPLHRRQGGQANQLAPGLQPASSGAPQPSLGRSTGLDPPQMMQAPVTSQPSLQKSRLGSAHWKSGG